MAASNCLVCLGSGSNDAGYHPRCIRKLFGTSKVPAIDLAESLVQEAGLAMAGRSTLSGVQKKISVKLSGDHRTLQIAVDGGRYVLKPQTDTFALLPEIEHTTMQLARLVKISTATNGLLRSPEGRLAYITRRFDRRAGGSKVRQEDFCQLAIKSPAEKYDGSAELCARIVRQFASEPGIEMLKLFRQLLFSWWVGNGDLHLKNVSLLVDDDGLIKLTPAYDLVSTALVIPDDKLAMPIDGRDQNIARTTWLRFAEYAGIQEKAAIRIINDQVNALPKSSDLIGRSYLSNSDKQKLHELLKLNTKVLSGKPSVA